MALIAGRVSITRAVVVLGCFSILCVVAWGAYAQALLGPCGYPALEADPTYRYPPNVTVQYEIHNIPNTERSQIIAAIAE